MKISQIHSHLNGFEYIQIRKKRLWKHLQELIASLDASKYLLPKADTLAADNSSLLKTDFYSQLETEDWQQYQRDYWMSNRIAIEVQFGKYSFVAYDLFVKHLAFYVGDKIDVGIEILPMKSFQQHMSSGPGYYEGELYNVIRQGRGVPAVPLVIIGVDK